MTTQAIHDALDELGALIDLDNDDILAAMDKVRRTIPRPDDLIALPPSHDDFLGAFPAWIGDDIDPAALTAWERQEIGFAYRNADRYTREVASYAASVLRDLHVEGLVRSMARFNNFAGRLADAIEANVLLRGRVDGAVHRIKAEEMFGKKSPE